MTPEGLFEPTISMNLPVTFYIMMNEILQNLINTEEIASFIDDIIMDVKLEKYKWNIKKVRFLRVVIGLEEIKIK